MPRNIRNWWITTEIDGRSTMAGGPRSKDGGFNLHIKQRSDGGIVEAVRVSGWIGASGDLILDIGVGTGDKVEIEDLYSSRGKGFRVRSVR